VKHIKQASQEPTMTLLSKPIGKHNRLGKVYPSLKRYPFSVPLRRLTVRREEIGLDRYKMLLSVIKGYLFMSHCLLKEGQHKESYNYLRQGRTLLNRLYC